jgi:hypothetical protein
VADKPAPSLHSPITEKAPPQESGAKSIPRGIAEMNSNPHRDNSTETVARREDNGR